MPTVTQGSPQRPMFKKLKVIFLINSLSGGGAERVTLNLATDWAARGALVTIVILGNADQIQYDVPADVSVIALGIAGASYGPLQVAYKNVVRLLCLRKLLAREGADVVIGMMSSTATLLGLIRTSGYMAIGSEHNHPPAQPIGRAWSFLRKWSYRRLDCVTALTEKSGDWLTANTHARSVAVIPNSITLPLPTGAPILPVSEIMMPGRRMLLAVGRLEYQKAFHRLIAAFQLVHTDHPDWDLVIVGEGTERGRLKHQIHKNNLQERVMMPGWIGNLSDWYQASELFAVTSRFEGFHLALLEAMAHGCAVLSVDCETGPSEMIDHERNGILVPQDDREALVNALDLIMKDEDRRRILGRAATHVVDKFSPARINDRWLAVFRNRLPYQGRQG